jgi:hypothetical protein
MMELQKSDLLPDKINLAVTSWFLPEMFRTLSRDS